MIIFKIKRKEYGIDIDPYQYILYEKVKRVAGEEDWVKLGYYNDLFYLLLKITRLQLIDKQKAKDLESAIKSTLRELSTSISNALETLHANK